MLHSIQESHKCIHEIVIIKMNSNTAKEKPSYSALFWALVHEAARKNTKFRDSVAHAIVLSNFSRSNIDQRTHSIPIHENWLIWLECDTDEHDTPY